MSKKHPHFRVRNFHKTTREGTALTDYPTKSVFPTPPSGTVITTNTTNYPTYTTCKHEGLETLWTYAHDGRTTEFVIANSTYCNAYSTDIVLDLAGNLKWKNANKTFITSGTEQFMALNNVWQPVPQPTAEVIQLEWPDYKVVDAPLIFWQKMLEVLSQYDTVMISCIGGHGRSGTCLASLMVADGWSGIAAIKHIRKVHCQKAVENSAQEDYVVILSGEDPDVIFGTTKKTSKAKTDTELAAKVPFLACVECKRAFKVASYVSDVCQDCWDEIKQAERAADTAAWKEMQVAGIEDDDDVAQNARLDELVAKGRGNGLDAYGYPQGFYDM